MGSLYWVSLLLARNQKVCLGLEPFRKPPMNWTLSTTASRQHLTLYGLQRVISAFSTLSDRRWGIKQTRSLHDGRIIHIPKADVFRFGDTKASDAIFKDLEWTVKDGENWAVIGATPSLKSELFRVSGPALPQHSSCSNLYYLLRSKVLRSRLRLKPSPLDGIFPFLHHNTKGALGHDAVLHVSFAPQQDRRISGGGGFTDYSARYGALWDEDRKTLRESLLEALSLDPPPPPSTEFDTPRKGPSDEEKTRRWNERIEDLADQLYLVDKLDLPTVALSNGQTRRARILRQLLKKPMLLLLDEPFCGWRPPFLHVKLTPFMVLSRT
jgi:energy-coupling factor transporter ATP-binding protein EcfA2